MTGLTAEQVKGKRGIFKYVRMNDGSFRFTPIPNGLEHKQIVPEGMTAISAGSIAHDISGEVVHIGHGSYTLGIDKSLPDDEAEIRKVLK